MALTKRWWLVGASIRLPEQLSRPFHAHDGSLGRPVVLCTMHHNFFSPFSHKQQGSARSGYMHMICVANAQTYIFR